MAAQGYCSQSGRNCVCNPGFAHGKDGICTVKLDMAEVPMDEALRIVLFYVVPVLGVGEHSSYPSLACSCWMNAPREGCMASRRQAKARC